MYVKVSAAGAFFGLVLVCACSGKHDRPPIETTGTGIPSPGVGTAPDSGGDSGAIADSGNDSAVFTPTDSGNEGGACLTGTCGGCCAPTGACEPGVTNTVCGVGGLACLSCGLGQSCINGGCQ